MGGGILLVKNRSLSNLLALVYPDYKSHLHSDIWTDENLANYFVEWLKKQPEREVGLVSQLVLEKKSIYPLTQILRAAFPQYKWINSKALSSKKSQYVLKECIEKIFNKEKSHLLLLEEYRHPDISNLELDYYLPQQNLAFEYQVRFIHKYTL